MKKVCFLLAVCLSNSNSKSILFEKPSLEQIDTNLQSQNLSTIPQFRSENYGLNHIKFTTSGNMQGRAEYFDGSVWKTICDDNFNINAAEIYCKFLNPNQRSSGSSWTNVGSLPSSRISDFSDGSQKGILGISCPANSHSITDCRFAPVTNCQHNEDVVVTCDLGQQAQNQTDRGNYRLAVAQNMTNSTGGLIGVWGRAENFNGSDWVQICYDNFTENSAKVMCKYLGLPFEDVIIQSAQTLTSILKQNFIVSGPDYVSKNFECNGDEFSLDLCRQGSQQCAHQRDTYIICQN